MHEIVCIPEGDICESRCSVDDVTGVVFDQLIGRHVGLVADLVMGEVGALFTGPMPMPAEATLMVYFTK
jgi:hypothetical protein